MRLCHSTTVHVRFDTLPSSQYIYLYFCIFIYLAIDYGTIYIYRDHRMGHVVTHTIIYSTTIHSFMTRRWSKSCPACGSFGPGIGPG